jgi:argininosuccinate lyase
VHYRVVTETRRKHPLTRKGMPFREAHNVVGRLVKYCEVNRKELRALTLDEYRKHSDLFDRDVLDIDVWTALRARDVPGGTAPRRVSQALRRARAILRRREEEA